MQMKVNENLCINFTLKLSKKSLLGLSKTDVAYCALMPEEDEKWAHVHFLQQTHSKSSSLDA